MHAAVPKMTGHTPRDHSLHISGHWQQQPTHAPKGTVQRNGSEILQETPNGRS
jgi:hypothetical protein